MSTSSEVDALRAGLEGHGFSSSAVSSFCTHFSLVLKWNPTHNLTRVTGGAEAAVLHYLDCALPLTAPFFAGPAPARFLDIGSGAGFPGLVAAILWPEAEAVLVEPARKRASFLQIAAGELGLRNIKVVAPGSLQAPLVLSRATFSSGARGSLWPYVSANGAPPGELWAWATAAELPLWESEVATWENASLTWHPYGLPTLPGTPPFAHGLAKVLHS